MEKVCISSDCHFPIVSFLFVLQRPAFRPEDYGLEKDFRLTSFTKVWCNIFCNMLNTNFQLKG